MKQLWKELKRWWLTVRNAGSPDDANREYTAALSWTTNALAWVKQRKADTQSEFTKTWENWQSAQAPADLQPRIMYYQVLSAQIMRVGAWFAILLECFLAGVLGALMLNLSFWAAVAIGIGFTLALTWFFKGLLATFFGRYESRPKHARHLMIWSLVFLVPTELALLIAGFLLSRGISDAANSDILFLVATSVLSITTPILSAVLLVGSMMFNWSKTLTGEYHSLLTLEREIASLCEYCDRSLEHSHPLIAPIQASVQEKSTAHINGVVQQPTSIASGKSIGAVVMVFMLFASYRVLPAQSIGEVYIDRTASVVQADFDVALDSLPQALGSITAELHISEWRFINFTDNAWTATPFYKLGVPVFRQPACPEVKLTELDKIRRGKQEAKVEEARRRCDHLIKGELVTYDTSLRNAFAGVGGAIRSHDGQQQSRRSCTSFLDALTRISLVSGVKVAIIITDGVETCRTSSLAVPGPKNGIQAAVVLLSTESEQSKHTPAQQFERRGPLILKSAPWINVVPPWGLNNGLFQEHSRSQSLTKAAALR